MRNLTGNSVVLRHAAGGHTLVKAAKRALDLPDLYQDPDAEVRIGPKQTAIRVRRQRRHAGGEREHLNAELRRHVNEDREETGDGIVLVEHDLLPLVDHDLRDSVFTPQPAISPLRASPLVHCLIGAGDLQ